MKQTPKNSKLFQFLLEKGVLGSTNTEAIQKAKAEYRKEYLKNAKRRQREHKKTITLSFTKDEFIPIQNYSKEYAIKYPQLIKQVMRAYFQERSIIIQPQKIHAIHYAYYQMVELLTQIHNKRNFSSIFSNDLDEALRELHRFHSEVYGILQNPHHKQPS